MYGLLGRDRQTVEPPKMNNKREEDGDKHGERSYLIVIPRAMSTRAASENHASFLLLPLWTEK